MKQGDILSSLLLVIHVDRINKLCKIKIKNTSLGCCGLRHTADCNKCRAEQLQRKITVWNNIFNYQMLL